MATEYIQISKKSLLRKTVERGITIGVWLLMFFFLYTELVENITFHKLILWTGTGAIIFLSIFFIYISWGYYNYMMFGRKNRRRNAPHASIEELAKCFHLSLDQAKKIRNKKEYTWRGPITIEISSKG